MVDQLVIVAQQVVIEPLGIRVSAVHLKASFSVLSLLMSLSLSMSMSLSMSLLIKTLHGIMMSKTKVEMALNQTRLLILPSRSALQLNIIDHDDDYLDDLVQNYD